MVGGLSVSNLKYSIEDKKNKSRKFIYSLGIRHGQENAKLLSKNLKNQKIFRLYEKKIQN